MNPIQRKGIVLAGTNTISVENGRYVVPSQSNPEVSYKVRFKSDVCDCTCPYYELVEPVWCKHIFAVEAHLRSTGALPCPTPCSPQPSHKKFGRNWSAYNVAREEELPRFVQLLADLCCGLPKPEPGCKGGRPCVRDSDLIFAAVMKVYFNRSGRHMPGFLRQAQKEGVIGCIPKASSILNFFGAERSTGYLRRLINLSCLPLRAVEGTTFAVDSTTFRLSRYERWYDEKRQDAVEERALVKAHMICGVKTHVIAQVEVTGGYEADGPRFSALLYRASDNFRIKEVSADAAYLSHENCVAAEIVGAEPFLWIKDGVTGRRGGVLEDLYHKFCVSHKEFVKRYNLRNNAESTHSVLKRRFKGPLSFRTERAIQNEILSMVLVHNLCCIIQCMVELGIEPEFWSEAASA